MNAVRLAPAACVFVIAFVFGPAAHAHESRPTFIELAEFEPGRYRLDWKVPPSVPPASLPHIMMPEDCIPISGPGASGPAYRGRALYDCKGPISDAVSIHYERANPVISAMIKYKSRAGGEHLALLGPQETSWTPPLAETPARIAAQYMELGARHIGAGVDHLLFLVCLLWIAGGLPRLLITVTGFTIAHSLTLGLAALKILDVAIAPVEAAIALSILFLAREIYLGPRRTLAWRYPIAVSSAFGLLHGLGFAAALNEIGLPQTQLLTGLVFFNIGVEIGQILFVTAVFLAVIGVRQAQAAGIFAIADERKGRMAAGMAVGVTAAYWLVERAMTFGPALSDMGF